MASSASKPSSTINPIPLPQAASKGSSQTPTLTLANASQQLSPATLMLPATDDKQPQPQSPDSAYELHQQPTTIVAKHHNRLDKTEPQGCCAVCLIFLSFLIIVMTFPFSMCFCIKIVKQYERAVVMRLGKLSRDGVQGPGLFFIIPCIDEFRKVDMRVKSSNVPPQEVLSKDSVTVAVDAVIYYRVQNAIMATVNIVNVNDSTNLLAQSTLRKVLGTKTLGEMLAGREQLSHEMQVSLDEATDPWGMKVERVEIKDIRLPQQMQRAMAAEAEADREARAKVIAARGEQEASRALSEAAKVISESPTALQLRYLQTLNTISAERNSTIIFPFPVDFISGLMNKNSCCRHHGGIGNQTSDRKDCEAVKSVRLDKHMGGGGTSSVTVRR